MKNLLLLSSFILLIGQASAVCLSPISRTNSGTNSVLTSTKYNLDLNTIYNRTNNLPGDCLVDDSVNGSKLIDSTVTAAKLASNSVTTAKIADESITSSKLAADIASLVPVGTILPYGGTTAPNGFLLGQGQSLSRTTYANLYAVIGTAFGAADGNSFNNVDCRGRFMRFTDGGQNRDPDRASRTAMNVGGNIGDNVGSVQSDQLVSHSHSIFAYLTSNAFTAGGANFSVLFSSSSSDRSTQATGGSETRPKNFNVNCIVRY